MYALATKIENNKKLKDWPRNLGNNSSSMFGCSYLFRQGLHLHSILIRIGYGSKIYINPDPDPQSN
jgi:hypothetical protein